MNRAAATVFVSDFDRGLASGDDGPPDRSSHVVIHNGATTAKKDPSIEPEIDVVFLGRLHPQKNPLALADILLALRPLEPVLAIIGNGECEAALRERLLSAGVAHQVRFVGARASAEALDMLGRARVLVLPSRLRGASGCSHRGDASRRPYCRIKCRWRGRTDNGRCHWVPGGAR